MHSIRCDIAKLILVFAEQYTVVLFNGKIPHNISNKGSPLGTYRNLGIEMSKFEAASLLTSGIFRSHVSVQFVNQLHTKLHGSLAVIR